MIDSNIKFVDFSHQNNELSISYDMYPVGLSGERYDLTKDFIHLKEHRQKVNFSLVDPFFVEHVKALTSFVIAKYSETTVFNYFNHIKKYLVLDSTSHEDIEDKVKDIFIDIVNNRSIAPESKSYLRSAYRFFAEEDMPYFDQDFVDFYLDEIKFGSGNKGLDVLVEMENRGCLKLSEQRKFKAEMTAMDYKSLPLIELQGFIALRIGQLTGARDVQVRKLKCQSLFKKTTDNKTVYFIKVPRAKQRGQSNNNQTVSRPITQRLGEQIEYLINIIHHHSESDNHYLLCPLSANQKSISNKILSPQSLRLRILSLSSTMNLDFKVTLRRLRKTFCSSLVARGVSMKVIAYLMDHSDLQQLGVYYRQTHSVAKKIDVILRKEAGDILDAFAGKIIKFGEESLQGQAIFAPTKDTKLIQIGSCGSGKLCVLNPPLSCYGCKSLEAFEDVEHSEILDQMTANAKETFGNEHAIQLAQDKNFLAAGALIKVIESGDYE